MPSITISGMRIAIASAVLILLNPTFLFAQSHSRSTHRPDADRMGMTCAEILQAPSSEWVAKFTSAHDAAGDAQLRGISAYGECYDERTDRLAAALARSRKGPSARERRDFRDLVAALDDFTAKALLDNQPPGDAVKKAYAALYEKVFRYEFYQSYELKAPASTRPKEQAPVPAPAPAPAPKTASAASGPAADAQTAKAPVSEMTLAKNRFGELLDAMPPDKLHEIHAAFGKVVEVQPIASDHELEIYRYAIFVLEPPAPPAAATGGAAAAKAKPFAPPPF